MNTKSFFKSKTEAVNFLILLAGIVAFFNPSTSDFVKDHAAVILTGIGFVNMAVRLITHGRITLFGSE